MGSPSVAGQAIRTTSSRRRDDGLKTTTEPGSARTRLASCARPWASSSLEPAAARSAHSAFSRQAARSLSQSGAAVSSA